MQWAWPHLAQAEIGPGPKLGQGPKWAWAQIGPGPKWARGQIGPGPKQARARMKTVEALTVFSALSSALKLNDAAYVCFQIP